jgi:ATP synthase protein I
LTDQHPPRNEPARKAGWEPDPDGARKRVDDLDQRLKAARGTVAKPRQSNAMSQRQTNVAYRVLADMIAGLLVGGVLGYWLDRWQGWTPYALVVGLVLGFGVGVYNAWRAIREYSAAAAKGESNRRLP